MAQTKKTDNDFMMDKVALRIAHLPQEEVRVLDCYAGMGVIWKTIEKKTGRKIKRLPIDTRDEIGFHLSGENVRFLKTLDLKKYNVIDLDAYGIPYEQLKILFERKFAGTVFVTFIQSVYGRLPNGMLREIGFSDAMTEKIPTLFSKRGWEYFLQWLALNGVTRITHRSMARKHYLVFQLC